MDGNKLRLGDILVQNGIIDQFQLKSALGNQKKWGKRLGETLIEMGFISENTLMKMLSKFFNIPSINLSTIEVDPDAVKRLPLNIVEKHAVMPIAIRKINQKTRLVVAMSDPTNLEAIDELQFTSGLPILPMVATLSGIDNAVALHYKGEERRGGFDSNERSGISMLALTPDDEKMAVIRDGEEAVISLGNESEQDTIIDLDDPPPATEADSEGVNISEELKEESTLFTTGDLDALDNMFAEDSAGSGFESKPVEKPPVKEVPALLPESEDKSSDTPAAPPEKSTGVPHSVDRMLSVLRDKQLITDTEKEAIASDQQIMTSLARTLVAKNILSEEEAEEILRALPDEKEN